MSPVENPVRTAETPETFPEDVIFPPGEIDSDEPPLETETHLRQILLFLSCLDWLWRDRTDYYAAGNLTIYYSPYQRKSEDFRGPDFFVVLGTQKKLRRSWVVWEEEGKYPNVIVEVLSRKTANTDRTTKKEIYQDTFRTPDYFIFDPEKLELVGYHLVDGKYEVLEPNLDGYLWSKQLGLYLGVRGNFVRFFTPERLLVPTPEEAATAERQQTEQVQLLLETERQQTEQVQQLLETERQKKERLAAKLRELNIDPDTL